MSSLPPSPILNLYRFSTSDPMLYTEVNANTDKIDLLTPTVCTSGTRPSVDLFQGRLIWETDTQKLMMYDLGTTTWKPALPSAATSIPWTAYTPTWGGIATPTTTARYRVIDTKTILYKIDAKVVTAPSAGVTVTLPVPAIAVATTPISSVFGKLHCKDVSAGIYFEGLVLEDTTGSSISTVRLMAPTSGASTQLTQVAAAVPFTWAVNDGISIMGEYEAA